MLKSTRCCDKQAKLRTFCPENICCNKPQLCLASQLNKEGVCAYPENGTSPVTCCLGVFIEAYGTESVLQFVRENVCPRIKTNCFPFGRMCLIVVSGIFFAWNLPDFPYNRRWHLPQMHFHGLSGIHHLFTWQCYSVSLALTCSWGWWWHVHKYTEIHLCVRLRVLEMALLLNCPPWIHSWHYLLLFLLHIRCVDFAQVVSSAHFLFPCSFSPHKACPAFDCVDF